MNEKLLTRFNSEKHKLDFKMVAVNFGSNTYQISGDDIRLSAKQFSLSEIIELKHYAQTVSMNQDDIFLCNMFEKSHAVSVKTARTTKRKTERKIK